MAASKNEPSFDEIIQTTRQRKRNEALANEIFGKGRRASTPAVGGRFIPGAGRSLASRVGITKVSKRSTSSASKLQRVPAPYRLIHSLPARDARSPRESPKSRLSKDVLPHNATTTSQAANTLNLTHTSAVPGIGLRIRGVAGPHVVIGTNFAPGTTSADIESVLGGVGDEMLSCKVLTTTPTVTAELVFTDKSGADNLIATFNNLMADGRQLHFYMKQGGPSPAPTPAQAEPAEPRGMASMLSNPAPLNGLNSSRSHEELRGYSDRKSKRADPEFQDGSYGFSAKEENMDVEMEDGRTTGREQPQEDHRELRGDTYHNSGRGSGISTASDSRRDERPDLGRGRFNARGRDSRGLYSDSFYRRPRGQVYR